MAFETSSWLYGPGFPVTKPEEVTDRPVLECHHRLVVFIAVATLVVISMCIKEDDVGVMTMESVDEFRVVVECRLVTYRELLHAIEDDNDPVERLHCSHHLNDPWFIFNILPFLSSIPGVSKKVIAASLGLGV